ncbi:hypothetical protein AQJ11_02970 [Streptomyces corchorusii]|uniref:Uncharacterized protein n=2 Tax=Streptomyces TaxID=1883 RepID=A0A124HPK6_STRCK|nr:hypothetical protein [Streptomyces corchorusii]KUN32504.1 hypothetical protein AQJ11_02970 [Streptomyces corchorusii]
MAAAPHSTAIARVLRGLGLTQGKGCDFRVTGDYRNGERIGTFVVVLTRHAEEVIAEHADEIERLSEEAGWPFHVSVRYHDRERPMVTVANYGSRVREEPPVSAVTAEPAEAAEAETVEPAEVAVEAAHEETAVRPAIVPAVLGWLWADDHAATVSSPLRDMIRSKECDKYGRPTKAAFERIAAELNALPADPAALAQLWADDHRAPVCSPLRDMVRGDECDDGGQPTMVAFERIAAEVKALALPVAEPRSEESGPRALPPAESEPAAEEAPDDLKALRLERAQSEALGWSRGQAELVAAAAAGQLYRDFGAVLRTVPVPGHPGRVASMHRLGPLVDAGFLAVDEPDPTGRRAVRVTADGRHALAVWKRWRPWPVEKTRSEETEKLRPLLHGAQARRIAALAREEEKNRRRESEELWAATRRLHEWEEREERLRSAWARVNGVRNRFQRRPVGWVPTDAEIAEYRLAPDVVAELRADAENPKPKPELPSPRRSAGAELPPLEADDQTPEQTSLPIF